MKRIITILLAFISFILLHISCSEDFLKPEPLSFYAPENVFVNQAGFKSALVTCRKDINSEFYGSWADFAMEWASSDYGRGIGLNNWRAITPSSGSYFPVITLFEKVYQYIKNTNVIISRIDDIKWEKQEDRNAILGQALFYRSWWYYRLIMSYGDVPFIGKELKGAKLDFYSHSKWTILEKLSSDLELAVQGLPEEKIPGVPNKYAALHLLSKIYLANTEFDKAIAAATQVINGPYALMRNRFGVDASRVDQEWFHPYLAAARFDLKPKAPNLFWDLHRPANKALAQNTESIFITIDRFEAPDNAKSAGSYFMKSFSPPWRYPWCIDSKGKVAYAMTNSDGSFTELYFILGRANPDVYVSPNMYRTLWNEGGYNWKNTPDLRRANGIFLEDWEIYYNEPTSVNFGEPINNKWLANPEDTLNRYPAPLYKMYHPHARDYKGQHYGNNADLYIFRLAETYLIRAEAYFWKGQLVNAANDINIIRERANAPLITAADVDIDYIFDERFRELFLEEFRHTELVRAANIMAKLNLQGYSLDNLSQKNWFYDRMTKYNFWFKNGSEGTQYGTTALSIIDPFNIYWPININAITTNTKGVINQSEGYAGSENNLPPLEVINDDN